MTRLNIKASCIDYIKQNKYTISLFCLLFVCSLVFRFRVSEVSFSSVIFALINTSFFYIILDLFVRFRFRYLVIAVLALLITIDIGLFYIYGDVMNYGVIASIFETNRTEVFDVLTSVLLVGIGVYGITFFLLWKAVREMKDVRRIHPVISVLYLFVTIIIIPPFMQFKMENRSFELFASGFKTSPHLCFASSIPLKYPLVIGDIFYSVAYLREMSIFRTAAQKEKKLPDDVIYNGAIKKPTKIVFILGESALRTHMSLYGYQLITTPFLDSISSNTSQLQYYNNIISPAGYTRDAVRIALSFATAHNEMPFLEEKTLLNLANDAKYETLWLSSQGRFGVDDSYVGMIAACANKSSYLEGVLKDDLSLIPILKSFLEPDQKQFIVLHLMGSHALYKNRSDKVDTDALGSEGEFIDYDKSIHHTDRLLRGIYQTLIDSKENFLIYYFSDHAEVVNVGHGIVDREKDQYYIPLITIQNDSLPHTDEIIQKYYDSKTGLLNASSTIYILAEILGYKISESRVEQAQVDGRSVYQINGSVKYFSNIKD